jgi:hypothetical protein
MQTTALDIGEIQFSINLYKHAMVINSAGLSHTRPSVAVAVEVAAI